jgi:hypothetical protein
MGPYDKELMIAILAASTTLAGLTGVVIGQIRQSKLTVRSRFCFSGLLVITFVFAGIAIARAINWLSSPEDWESQEARCYFEIQLVLFLVVATAFWLSDLNMRIRLTSILTVLKKVRKSIVSAIFIVFSWLLQQFTRVRETIQAACKKACEKVKKTILAGYSWILKQVLRLWEAVHKGCKKENPEDVHVNGKEDGELSKVPRAALFCITAIVGGVGLAGYHHFGGGIAMAVAGIYLYVIGPPIMQSKYVAKRLPRAERDNWQSFIIALSVALGIGGLGLTGLPYQTPGIAIASIGGASLFIIVIFLLAQSVQRKLRGGNGDITKVNRTPLDNS